MARTLVNAHQLAAFSGSSATQAKFAEGTYTAGLSMESGSVSSAGTLSFYDGGSIAYATSMITLYGAARVTSDMTVDGDIIIDDGGSLKEGGGTAAFTFDGSGHVTKIGQDSPSNGQFLKWDGSKAVWDAAALSGLGSTDNILVRTNGTGGGTAQGSGITVDDSDNLSGIGTIGCGAITATGTSTFATACSPDAVDGATLGSTGAEWSDLYLADGGRVLFGNDSEVTLTHVADVGLTVTHTGTGDNLPVVLQLKSEEDAVIADEVIASLEFAAGDSDGSDGALVAAGIHAIAEETFAADANATKLVFTAADSETAAASATAKMTLASTGNLTTAGSITAVGSFIIGSADMNEADLEKLDGITNGTAAASKAVVLDGSKNIATIGTIGCGAVTSTGNSSMAQLTTSGRVIVDDTTAATTATDGSLQTDGGLSVALDAVVGDDLILLSDSAVIHFGASKDTTLTHVADSALLLNSSRALAFGDADTYINQPADGYLRVAADTAVQLLSDTVSIDSANANDPLVLIKNTTNDTAGGRLQFTKDKGAAGADNDTLGTISWVGDNDAQEQTSFADILCQIADASNGTEGGRLVLRVASHDGEMNNGLVIVDGDLEDEVDITLGNGSASTVTIPGNLTVTGTTTTVNTVTMNAANAVVFEGATADNYETTLTIVDPLSDQTIYLPDAGGYIPLIVDASTADGAVTAAEFALLDGGSTVGTTAVANGDGIFTNDGGVMKQTTVQTFQTYFDANSVGGTSMVSVGALDAGSITSGFGNIDNGSSTLNTGVGTVASLVCTAGATFGGGLGNSGVTITTGGALSTDGRIVTDDATEATSTTDGSLQTDGGLSVAKSAVVGIDLDMLKDGAVANFGANKEVNLTHVHNTGLLLNSAMQLQFGDNATHIAQSADGTLKLTSDGDIEMAVGASGVKITGTTPKLTIGDAGAEDTMLVFDGNAQDFRIGIDDGTDVLEFGVGSAHGTNAALKILANQSIDIATDLIIGDDLTLFSDSAVINFGADNDITLTHVADTGLIMGCAHANGTNLRLDNTAGDGDSRIEYQLGGTTVWSMGVEDGDSDKFVIEDGAGALGADPAFEIAADKSAKFYGSLECATLFKMPDVTAGKFLVGDGTSYQEVALSGDATLASNGAVTIAADSVQDSMVHDDVATGLAGNGLTDASGVMKVDFYVDRIAGSGGDNYTSATGVYALENSNLSGSEMVFLNGQMLHKASTDDLATGDYTCLTGSVELHPDLKLDADDVLAVYYLK